MIRPSSLIRSESNTPRIEANAINIKKESLDCGITAMRCCNTPACQKLGTSKLFVTLLIFVGIILGASERYFQLSARQAAVELNFQPVEILGNKFFFFFFDFLESIYYSHMTKWTHEIIILNCRLVTGGTWNFSRNFRCCYGILGQ